jgi:hypothetical protein
MGEQYEEGGEDYGNNPNPGMGEPTTSLELEEFLAVPKPMMTVIDPNTKQQIQIGDIPNAMKRKLYGMLGKQVINAYFTEKDLRVKKLQNFIASIHEEMWTPLDELNKDNGRGLLDLEQARIYANDLVTQAYFGMHSKQRTTYTHINMAGRIDGQSSTPQKPAQTGGYF